MSDRKATILIDGEHPIELPIHKGTLGQDVIDVGTLGNHGYFTYDPSFTATASCRSEITYIDGNKGVLLHRGYPIEELAEKSDYIELCYLLLEGSLPTADQKSSFEHDIKYHTMVNRSLEQFISGFRWDAHPMSMVCGVVGAMSSIYHDSLDITNQEHRKISAHRLIAKMPTIAAMCYKHFIGQPYIYPDNKLGYSENFLHMMFGTPCEKYECHPALAKAMDKIFLLHADHEQNASTSTVRLCGSSGTSPYAAVASGIACLWGPAHGGANQACLEMLERLYHDGGLSKVGEFMEKVKDKDSGVRLMGFGHRVYKNFDPRAKIMQETCREVLAELGLGHDPFFKLALAVEKIALEDPYFVERKLYPNVDFYSGITLRALGVPTEMFTSIFALARTIGWISQWKEMITDSEYRIGRPRQSYVGSAKRQAKSIKSR